MDKPELTQIGDNRYGRLHKIKKSRKSFYCKICFSEIPAGSQYFSQSEYIGTAYFPIKISLCEKCAKERSEKHGVEIV